MRRLFAPEMEMAEPEIRPIVPGSFLAHLMERPEPLGRYGYAVVTKDGKREAGIFRADDDAQALERARQAGWSYYGMMVKRIV